MGQVPDPDPTGGVDVELGTRVGGGADSALLTTLIVGVLLIALAPEFTERKVATVWNAPLSAALWGLLGIGGVLALSTLLVITLVGIPVAITLLLVADVAWAVGSALAFLRIGERGEASTDRGDRNAHRRLRGTAPTWPFGGPRFSKRSDRTESIPRGLTHRLP